MTTPNDTKTITIDLEVLLIPFSIIVSSIMISASILYSFGDFDFSAKKSNTTAPTLSDANSIAGIIEDIDVDLDKFNACVAEDKFASEIEKDTTDGQAAGITGTPGFIVGTLGDDGQVNGVVISGAQAYATFKDAIDKQIAGTGEKSAKVNIDDDPIKGNKDKAKVAIVEFSDFECPFCQRFHSDTFSQIVSDYIDNDKAIYVYRDFPLSFHEPKASEAANAANCVREVAGDDKFFEFSTIYYKNTQSNGKGLPS